MILAKAENNSNTISIRQWQSVLKQTNLPESKENRSIDVKNEKILDMGNNMIPLYCAIMGILIVGLVIFVIIKHCQRRNQNLKTKAVGSASDKHFKVPIIQPLLLDKKTNERKDAQGSVECDLGSDLTSAATSTQRFLHVEDEVKRRLEIGLHSESCVVGNWKSLAKELGYQDVDIVSFESQATEEHVPACRCLLERWGANSLSTVGALSRALHKINRRDLIMLLREERRGACAQKYLSSNRRSSENELATASDVDRLCSV